MNRRENQFWMDLRKQMAPLWMVQRHEDKYWSDVPDLSFSCRGVDGWIELKVTMTKPAANKSFDVTHLTPGQRQWLVRHGQAGAGHCFALVRVIMSAATYEHLLIHWSQFEMLGKMTYTQWQDRACGWWGHKIIPAKLIDMISN